MSIVNKKYGIKEVVTTIKELALKTKDDNKKHRILVAKEKLKSDLLKSKITIKNIKNINDIDKISINKKLYIYINPYYELMFVKSLKTFPVKIIDFSKSLNLLNIEYYLTLSMMYWHDYNKVLYDFNSCSYTKTEVYYYMDVLENYYDVENPQKKLVEKNPEYLYYNVKPDIIKQLEKDIEEYEYNIVLKSIKENKSYKKIKEELFVCFDEEKYNKIKQLILKTHV